MKDKLLIMFFLLASTVSVTLHGQSNTKSITQPVIIPSNVDANLTQKESAFLLEVFNDKLDQYILNSPNRLRAMKHLLRNRIEVKFIQNITGMKYENLNDVPMFTAYNTSLERDTLYNEDTFNALKYDLPFFGAKGKHIYRINNTNHFLIIKPLAHKK